MQVQTVPIADLVADPTNARRHPERNLDQIVASLERFGQQLPLVVGTDRVVRVGSGRLAAMRRLGWTHAGVLVSDLPLAELRAYAVADNRTAELAEWDADVLAILRGEPDMDLPGAGFTDAELDDLINASVDDGDPDAPTATSGAPFDAPYRPGKPIKVTAEQREGLDEAFAKFRRLHADDGMALSEGQMLILMAAEWAAGN